MTASAKGTIEEPGRNVRAKSGLNRRILDQGWGEFRRQLGYKLEMFNLRSVVTGQTIHLCGMLTEAIHTPFLSDRMLSLENARYVMNTARDLGDEIELKPGGIVERRAAHVLRECETLLERVAELGLTSAIEGVFERADGYWNPFEETLRSSLAS